MSSPSQKAGPPSSGSASRSSSIASNPPIVIPEGNENADEDTPGLSPSPPQYPPILGGSSSSSTPPSLRRTIPITSTTITVSTGTQGQRLYSSVSVGSRGSDTNVPVARRPSDELTAGLSSIASGIGGSSTTTISNVRPSPKQQSLNQSQTQPLQPRSSGILSGATSSISMSGVSSDSPSISGTTTSVTSIRRRNLADEVIHSYSKSGDLRTIKIEILSFSKNK